MIQFDKDGVTLYYIDASGKRFWRYYTEGDAYNEMEMVRGAQLQAVRENTQAEANYNTTLGNLQANGNSSGRWSEIVAPAKPLQKVVSDTGEVSYTPFVPPLADLVIPPQPAPGGVHGLVNVGTNVPTPPDKQAIMYNMILAIFRKMFPEA
jgi:hypothetical protein